ncbi:MAG TPA: amidase family protein, partial [Syntrophales bacterium]|nr:amidase family protein [Syntrophales bacterium]
METFSDYDRYDGLGLAELIRKGEVSAREVCEAAILRIETLNPALNAVIQPMFDLGRRAVETGLPDGPFRGVPYLLKDLVAAYAGVPLTAGSRARRDFIPGRDSELVRRFKQA